MKKIKLLVPTIASIVGLSSAAAMFSGAVVTKNNPDNTAAITWAVDSDCSEYGSITTTGATTSIDADTTFSLLDKPELTPGENCHFAGWYCDGSPVDASKPLDADHTGGYEFKAKFFPTIQKFDMTKSVSMNLESQGSPCMFNLSLNMEIPTGYTSYDPTVTWTIEDTSVLAFEGSTSKTGATIKALKIGTTTVTASCDNGGITKSATCTVTVTDQKIPVKEIEFDYIGWNPGEALPQGFEDKQITTTISPAGATDKTLTWSSSNEEVIKVDQTGKISSPTTPKSGSAIIVAKSNTDAVMQCVTLTVQTSVSLVSSVELPYESMNINPGQEIKLDAELNKGGTVPSYPYLRWESSNPSIAKVDVNGKITGLEAGTATITAYATDDLRATESQKHDSITINVIDSRYTVDITTTEGEVTDWFESIEAKDIAVGGNVTIEGTTLTNLDKIAKATATLDGQTCEGKVEQTGKACKITFNKDFFVGSDPKVTNIAVSLEMTKEYSVDFDLGEGLMFASLTSAGAPVTGDNITCSYQILGGIPLTTRIQPATSWIELNDETRVSGANALTNITATTFEINADALSDDTWKIHVHLDTNESPRWTKLTMIDGEGVYGSFIQATYSDQPTDIIAKYNIDALYDLDLSDTGTYVEIDGTKYYYQAEEGRWSLNTEEQTITIPMDAATPQDTVINVCLKSKAAQIKITPIVDDETHFLQGIINQISVAPNHDIKFEWLVADGWKLDLDTSKTYCEITIKLSDSSTFVLTTGGAFSGNIETIHWNPYWELANIVEIKAYTATVSAE